MMTQQISEVMNPSYEGIQTYRNLVSALNKAKADISFWGTRYVTVENCQGRYPLHALMKHVEDIRDYSPGADWKERNQLLHKIQAKVEELMQTSSEKLEKRCHFTQLCVCVKEIDTILIDIAFQNVRIGSEFPGPFFG